MANAIVQPLLDDEVPDVDDIGDINKQLIGVHAGQGEGVERDPGLLITNEDVRRIHRYVKTGLELPTDLEQIKQILGAYEVDVVGLEPEAIQVLYIDIHEHAASWSALESDMREVGSDLFDFSGDLINTAQHIVDFIQSLDAWRTLKPDDLTPEQIKLLPSIKLDDGDRKALPGLVALVGEIGTLINRHSGSTIRVRDGVSVFKERLRGKLAPSVALKIQLAQSAETDEAALDLQNRVNTLNQRIEELTGEYEQYARNKWLGFIGGVWVGAATFTIYGRKAREALAEKDRKISEKQGLENKLRQLNKFVARLNEFETSLQDLKSRMDGATSSVSNIESLWVLLAKLVSSSQDSLKDLDDGTVLILFVLRFENLIDNWVEIQKQSRDLLTAFNNVLEESDR